MVRLRVFLMPLREKNYPCKYRSTNLLSPIYQTLAVEGKKAQPKYV